RMVRRSSRACEGCWCMPSPALRTGRRLVRARRFGAPLALWRRMMHSAPRARRVRPVSLRVSPFSIDELLSETSVVVAPSDLAAGCRHHAAGKGGLDGQLAVSAIDQDEELDGLGATVVEECVKRGADGAAGEEDVVHQDDVAAGDVESDVALGDGGAGAGGGQV